MKVYKHWLKIDWRAHGEAEDKQWNNLHSFLSRYPESKITVFNKTAGNVFEKIFCLETTQKYNDLDLDCNSFFSGSLTRMERKPSNIEKSSLEFEMHYSNHFNR
jgi:hypothetical protein